MQSIRNFRNFNCHPGRHSEATAGHGRGGEQCSRWGLRGTATFASLCRNAGRASNFGLNRTCPKFAPPGKNTRKKQHKDSQDSRFNIRLPWLSCGTLRCAHISPPRGSRYITAPKSGFRHAVGAYFHGGRAAVAAAATAARGGGGAGAAAVVE